MWDRYTRGVTWDDVIDYGWWIGPWAMVTLVLVWRVGWLSPRAMISGPRRIVGLGPFDLVAALGLMLLGSSVATLVIDQVAPPAKMMSASPTHRAALILWSQVATFLGPTVYVLWRARMHADGWRRLGVMPRQPLRDIGAALIGLVVALPLVFGAILSAVCVEILLGLPVPKDGHEMITLLKQSKSGVVQALVGTMAIGLAPLFEELLYRGLLQTALVSVLPRRRWVVVLVASAMFALVHAMVPWHALPGLFVLGVVLGWLYERTGSLWPPIGVHAGFNAVSVATTIWVT